MTRRPAAGCQCVTTRPGCGAPFLRIEILIGDLQNLFGGFAGDADADRHAQAVADLRPVPLFDGQAQSFADIGSPSGRPREEDHELLADLAVVDRPAKLSGRLSTAIRLQDNRGYWRI
ncbi:hypothetical protein ATY76_28095 [Rhizobium sp. R339]|nr:hypothetical protein ATY76_28095 [Rhizobium sp. R339]